MAIYPSASMEPARGNSSSQETVKADIELDVLNISLKKGNSTDTQDENPEDTITVVEDQDIENVALSCLSDKTLEALKLRLDIPCDAPSDDGVCSDFRGVAEWAHLDQHFIKYIENVQHKNKTSEVISMWLKGETDGPKAIVGNLLKCLEHLERHDILLDLTEKISE